MKVMNLNFIKFFACVVLVVGLSASAIASCGDSLSGMAVGAALARNQSHPMPQASEVSTDNGGGPSMVGLWHIQFVVSGQTIQEAFQLWNGSGTEIHNPNVDPRTGNVCLGVWKRAPKGAYKLAHRVWNYDANGTYLGTINLSETITLNHRGNKHSGAFTLDFYDPSGVFQFEVAGSVTGERISVK